MIRCNSEADSIVWMKEDDVCGKQEISCVQIFALEFFPEFFNGIKDGHIFYRPIKKMLQSQGRGPEQKCSGPLLCAEVRKENSRCATRTLCGGQDR